jgi:phage gp29-like protein
MAQAPSRIVDALGRPIERKSLDEPQSARISALHHEWIQHGISANLSPAKLSAILREADDGDLLRQHQLFEDMVELGKRSLAVLGIDWEVRPPREASAAEKSLAKWVEELLRDMADFDDLLLALMDAVGHGFAPIEFEWEQSAGEWWPKWHARPQTWFRLGGATRDELLLRDDASQGQPLRPFGWMVHTPRRPKTGYLGRLGLHRTLSWPYLYKSYGLGDFAEFLETYGLPMIVGKFYPGASEADQSSLLRAVQALGHDARAVMPADMEIEIKEVLGGGGGQPLHLRMVEWADKAQSKAILGATLTSQADGQTSTNALGLVHEGVRRDILKADSRQLAATLTRDLLYPLVALNRPIGIDGLRRAPRLVFDVEEPEDVKLLADALPKLAQAGMRIPRAWAQGRLKIPEPTADEDTLGAPAADAPVPRRDRVTRATALAALRDAGLAPADSVTRAVADAQTIAAQRALDDALDARLAATDLNPQAAGLIGPILAAIANDRPPGRDLPGARHERARGEARALDLRGRGVGRAGGRRGCRPQCLIRESWACCSTSHRRARSRGWNSAGCARRRTGARSMRVRTSAPSPSRARLATTSSPTCATPSSTSSSRA